MRKEGEGSALGAALNDLPLFIRDHFPKTTPTTMGNGSRARRRPSTPRIKTTNRLYIALILSVFFVLSIYSVDKLDADLLHYITSYDEESLSSSSQRRQLIISDNVWEAELRERQLRATGPKTKQQRVQIQRKRMLEDVGGPPGDKGKGHRGPPQRYVSYS